MRLSLLLGLLTVTVGCVAKFGGVAPAAGRAGEAFSTGAEVIAPLLQPATVGERGMMIALPYEENRRFVEHAAGLSSGAVRMQSLGAEFRLLQLLFFAGERQQDELKTTTRHSRVRKKRTEKEPAAVSLYLGIGPEYHWNSFNISEKDLASAGSRGVFYEENIRDCWGGRVSIGLFSLSRSEIQKQQGEAGGTFIVSLSFHWTYAETVVDGVSGGVPYNRSRRENMQWLSLFIGFGLGF